MNEEIIQQAIQAIKGKLRALGKGPGQRFAQVALADAFARFPGGYAEQAFRRLVDQGLVETDPASHGRFLVLTGDGYLWLTR